MARTEWLSEGVEKLAFELLEHDEPKKPHCDVAIIGSGYGGAVAAARLAGARDKGLDRQASVWVLERGREFLPGSFPERFADLPGQVRIAAEEGSETHGLREGLFDLRIGEDVSALLANGLGGGSLINAGVLARPTQALLKRAEWLPFAGGVLDPYFDKAEAMLGARELPGRAPAKLAGLAQLGARIEGAKAARARIAVTFDKGSSSAGVPQEACVGCGDCFTGCNHSAKNTLAMNYLPLAWRRGARLVTGVTVLSVQPVAGGEGWSLELEITDREIDKRFGKPLPPLRARHVVLAAGAYGSTAILLRSAARGFRALPTRELGRHFSTNGDMIAVGYGMAATHNASARETDAPDARQIGPTITGMIDLRERFVPFVIEELAIPAALRRAFEEVVTTFGALHALESIDWSHHSDQPSRDPAAIDPAAMARTAVYATIGDDGAKGRIRLRPGTLRADDGVRVEWKRVAREPVFTEAMKALAAAHPDAALIPNPMWRLLPEGMAQVLDGGNIGGTVFTVHPLGGCAMGRSAEDGVVNHLGQVYSTQTGMQVHRTLAVLDGAIVPTAIGINPCLTIAALSEYAVERLAAEWGLDLLDDNTKAGLRPLPRRAPPKSEKWQAPRPTALRLAERLRGKLNVDGKDFDAVLLLEYQDVPDVEGFLSAPDKILPIHRATLQLCRTDSEGEFDETLKLEGELRFFAREATSVGDRVWTAGRAWWANRGRRELSALVRSIPRRLWTRLAGLPGRISHYFIGRPRSDRPKKPGLGKQLQAWFAVASHAGERRLMKYSFRVMDGNLGPLKPDALIAGTKRIEYISQAGKHGPWPSPWDQLTKLPLVLDAQGAKTELGWLDVDLPYFVQQYATQLQVASQENQPRAIADLFSFLGYVLRVVGKIHIWSLRAPDYPDPYPIHAFNRKERMEADTRARKVVKRTERRRVRRLPGKLPGFTRQRFPLALGDSAARPQGACLTHYAPKPPRAQPAGPVLLIHGLGAGGNTFTLTTIDENLVQHLASKGFDPWVLDLSTSIGLPSSKMKDWTFEEIAYHDIPAAIGKVLEITKRNDLSVVAHCIGAAMFSMAALEGWLPKNSIKAAVLSQVGPLLELPPTNRFRGYIASYLKHYLNIDEFDNVSTLSTFSRFLDRLLAGVLPYPWYEWDAHRHVSEPITHESYCLRSYGIYGRLFEHKHLNHRTLERLGDYLGHLRYRTYQQTIYYATMGRLTDQYGNNLVTYEKIRDNFAFPVCFLHGKRNQVFDKRTSERSFDLLASIFWSEDLKKLWKDNPGRRYDYALYRRGRSLRIVEIGGYGHQDCMIGKRAHRHVYPSISGFLLGYQPVQLAEEQLVMTRPPRLGPIVGWLREDKGEYVARVLFAPNDSRSKPKWAMTILLKDGLPHYARFRELANPDAPTQALDVRLPRDDADYAVSVVTLHQEQCEADPLKDLGSRRGDDPFGDDLDGLPSPAIKGLPASEAQDAWPHVHAVLRTCKDLRVRQDEEHVRYEPISTGEHVSHSYYAKPVTTAILRREVLQAARDAERPGAVCFALASCRYAAAIADREAADRAFGRLRELVAARSKRAPQLLFLAGDSIYADATYGIFDPEDPKERFDQRYLEAWSAPNAREVLRSLPTYPMLDDHEVHENFEGRSGRLIGQGLDAFESFQLRLTRAFDDPQAVGRKRGPYWYRTKAAGYEFFVADTRTDRRRTQGRGSANARIMDRAQMKDLECWLDHMQRRDPEIPKFIVSPSVVAPWSRETRGHRSYALRADAWDGFPRSLRHLLAFIAGNGIRNVVFLSGDYHCSVYCPMWLRYKGKPPVQAYSIVSSGMYAPYPFANTRLGNLELTFSGSYARRLGETTNASLTIDYRTQPIKARDSFVTVLAERSSAGYELTLQADSEHGVPTDPPIRVPLYGGRRRSPEL
jgi:choline dehydrogenase-like flavoprotein/predicted alpha/beta hydrolase